ncbi:MAG: ArsR family transcriptional regulator [bacterium]|nr:ArsR family transcriptional regulator [bacterium]
MKKGYRLPRVGKCFDHLGGRLAPLLFEKLLELKWIVPKEGKKTVFEITAIGRREFDRLGVDLSKLEEEG